MKTPREILLQRHQAANAKLDQIRRVAVARLPERPAAREQSLPIAVAFKLWRELIWPCRRTWAGLTAAWFVILAFNLTHSESVSVVTPKSTMPPGEMRLALQEQQRILAEIIGPNPPTSPAEPPRRPTNQPRSERRSVAMA